MLTDVYATCAPGLEGTGEPFNGFIARVARWTEDASLRGLLVFTDNESVDVWSVAQFMIERTTSLVPLVAVQPAYMHPYTAARMVSSITSMYGRRIDLNLIAGGFKRHLYAVGTFLDHDDRYGRLIEYGDIMARLWRGGDPLTHFDTHYEMVDAVLNPPLPQGLEPRLFLAGTSPAAFAAARRLGAVRLTYPLTPSDYIEDRTALNGIGIRVGVIARDTNEQAWKVARQSFPEHRMRELAYENLRPTIDSHWHNTLWQRSDRPVGPDETYWLYPFRVAGDFCPYLVGSHAEVAQTLSGYLEMGIVTLILNTPRSEDDLGHAMTAVREAEHIVARTALMAKDTQ